MARKPKTIDEYLAALSDDKGFRKKLQRGHIIPPNPAVWIWQEFTGHTPVSACGEAPRRRRNEPRISSPSKYALFEVFSGSSKRAALETLRKTIKAAAPGAEECISYGLPAFRLNGRMPVAFGATVNHCAFYPMSSSTVENHKDDLKGYDTSKGIIRFQADHLLPVALVRMLVKARINENAG